MSISGLILAAGSGSRLGEKTKHIPKCMLEVGGERIIDRQLRQLKSLGIEDVIVVTGYKSDVLKQHLSQHKDIQITAVENTNYHNTNNIFSLHLAFPYVKNDFLLIESDVIVEDSALKRLAQERNAVLLSELHAGMNGTVVRCEGDSIHEFSNTSRISDSSKFYKTVNAYKFSFDFFNEAIRDAIDNLIDDGKTDIYYENAFDSIQDSISRQMKPVVIKDEYWFEIDTDLDLEAANELLSYDIQSIQKRYGGFWRYPNIKDFAYLVNPFFPDNRMMNELKSSFDELVQSYPSSQNEVSKCAAKLYGVQQNMIAVGNGASEIIKSLVEMQNGVIGFICPSFEEYNNRIFDDSRKVIFKPRQELGFRYSANDLIQFFSNTPVDCIVIVNPDNPSGNLIEHKDMAKLLKWAKARHIKLIVDESFIDFANEPYTLIDNVTLAENRGLTVVRSISKTYGIAGLRLGVAASSDIEKIDLLRKDMSIWNINSIAENFLQIMPRYASSYEIGCKKLRIERDKLYEALSRLKSIEAFKSSGNFILARFRNIDSNEVVKSLLAKNIIVNVCHKKNMEDGKYIRIAVRDSYDNDYLVKCLREILNEQ